MKTKTIKGMSLLITLLVITSTFTITTFAVSIQSGIEPPGGTPEGDIEFSKTVWDKDLGLWVELIFAEVGEIVRFNITLTYHKHPDNELNWSLHHIHISDILPECLEFANNASFYNAPTISELIIGNVIFWNFSDYNPMLYDGESMSIEFDAVVVESQELENQNWATVEANECNQYYPIARDDAWVIVEEPDIDFEKKVWNGNAWVEVTDTSVGSTVRFKISLTYFGEHYLHNIKIYDKLPCCLDYANNANIPESYVSEDLKEIWWNLTGVIILDGETLSIEFDALVTGVTSDECGGCDGINIAIVYADEGCCERPYTDQDNASIISTHRPCPPIIRGDESGRPGQTLTYYIRTYDPDGDNVAYLITWGDFTGETTGFYSSGEEVMLTNYWIAEGTYEVKAKAVDINGAESDYSNTLTVEIASSKFDICLKTFSYGQMKVSVKNIGTKEVSDVECIISVKGGLLNRINVETIKVFPSIQPGEIICISTPRRSIRGFGRITTTITITAPDEPPMEETYYGFVLGKWIIDTTYKAH